LWTKAAVRLLRLPRRDQLLLAEALLFLGLARFGTVFVPFRRFARLLGCPRAESAVELTPAQLTHARRIRWAVVIISRHTIWHSSCLVQAIAAQLMLKRRRIPSTLYLGVAKNDDQDLIAHAWVRSGHAILTGAPDHGQFTVVSTFAIE